MKKYCFLLFFVVLATACGKSDTYIIDRVVGLTNSDGGFCSGEQVTTESGQTYVLTASHCLSSPLSKDPFVAKTEDGKEYMLNIIKEDPNSDLLLLEGIPNLDGLNIASSSWEREHVRTFTHGHRFDTYITDGVLIQKDVASQVPLYMPKSEEELQKCRTMPKLGLIYIDFIDSLYCLLVSPTTAVTAMTAPGSSGGPMVDDRGDLIGVVSAGDGTYNYFVDLNDIKKFLHSF